MVLSCQSDWWFFSLYPIYICSLASARTCYSLFGNKPGVHQPVKLKSEVAEYDAESTGWTTSPGYMEVVNSPLQTPASGKGVRGQRASRAIKSRAAPHTLMSNVG